MTRESEHAEGRLWGLLAAGPSDGPLPPDTERLLVTFAGVAAAAVAGTDTRDDLQALADEQAALLRVAELVAQGAGPDELFDAVAREASGLVGDEPATLARLDGPRTYTIVASNGGPAPVGLRVAVAPDDGGLMAEILRTWSPARLDDDPTRSGPASARDDGGRSSVGVPVLVDDRIWGILGATANRRRFPTGVEQRLGRFAGLTAATLSNVGTRMDLQELADEQAALRRVAQLSARSGASGMVLEAVAREASALLGGGLTALMQFQDQVTGVVAASSGDTLPVGSRYPVQPGTVMAQVLQTGRPARVDDYSELPAGKAAAGLGVQASVGVPVGVDGRLWGTLITGSALGPLPRDDERRLLQFAEIVSAAVSAAQARRDLREIAEEQAALRRVAELVARAASPTEVFSAVAREASRLLDGQATTLTRFDGDAELLVVASHGGPAPLGERIGFEPDTLPDRVLRGASVVRVDDYTRERDVELAAAFAITAAVSTPIVVAGAVWGMLTATSDSRPLPPGTEQRLGEFAQLVAAALGNSLARTELRALADEQAGLRRVAELVARGAALEEMFVAVTNEASALLGDLAVALVQYDDEREDEKENAAAANPPVPLGLPKPIAVPIIVEDRVRAALVASSSGPPLPADTTARLTPFAELAAVAIANAETKAKLTASRARVVATADETRRRLQRDVHDGAQQRLVHTLIALRLARDALVAGASPADLIDEALTNAERANNELRDVVQASCRPP